MGRVVGAVPVPVLIVQAGGIQYRGVLEELVRANFVRYEDFNIFPGGIGLEDFVIPDTNQLLVVSRINSDMKATKVLVSEMKGVNSKLKAWLFALDTNGYETPPFDHFVRRGLQGSMCSNLISELRSSTHRR